MLAARRAGQKASSRVAAASNLDGNIWLFGKGSRITCPFTVTVVSGWLLLLMVTAGLGAFLTGPIAGATAEHPVTAPPGFDDRNLALAAASLNALDALGGVPIADIPKHTAKELNLPGMHGYRGRRHTEYGVRLVEKQKLRAIYGVSESQMRRYYDEATLKSPRARAHFVMPVRVSVVVVS